MPDLSGRTVIGASSQLQIGTYLGDETSLLNSQLPVAAGGSGQPVDNREPSAALTYLIPLTGIFPPHDSGSVDPDTQYLGEIVAVAFDANVAPTSWAEAKGQLLPINQHQALFSLLGTMYGGDGITTFALPDLRGRAEIGTGDEAQIAHVLGSNTFTLVPENIPERLHDFNGDFNSDVLWRHDSGQVYVWQMDGLGTTAEGAVAHAPVPNTWHIEGTGDFDADLKGDILWRHDSGQVYVWEMNGLNVKTEGTIVHAAVPATWHVEGISDFDGDRKSDILWRHDSGQVYLWEMNGLGIRRQCRGRKADAKAEAGLPAEAAAKVEPGPKTATVERRKASVRFAVQAQRKRRASPARLTRAERRDEEKKMRLSALRPPLDSVGENEANPRANTRGNE
jgi:microcystin-dependent protein